MAKIHIFKSRVLHDKKEFVKGQECPESMHKEMLAKGLIEPLPEAVKPVEPEKK